MALKYIELEKEFFSISMSVLDDAEIFRLSVMQNDTNYNLISNKNSFFAGSHIHNPSRMTQNLNKHFIDKLSVQDFSSVYENDYARFAVVVLYDHTVTLFFKENDFQTNKFLLELLTNQTTHSIKDIWFLFLSKTEQ